MNDRPPLLFEIKGNSLDDGPGIRTVVFFKGCPLDCAWCHNPESKSPLPEISHDPRTCIDCGHCMEICPCHAVSRENPFFIDRSRCTLCGACMKDCPSESLSRVGFALDVEEVARTVLRDKPFFDNSGGGVTLSGGEPTLYMDYAGDLARTLKARGVHVLLETCGLFPYPRFAELLLPYLDIVYFDLKLLDEAEHLRQCGASNAPILDNFLRLALHAQASGMELLPRVPLVPGITDTDHNISALAAFLRDCGVPRAALLPYNPLWHDKCLSVGTASPLKDLPGMSDFMDRGRIEHCRKIFRAAGISA